MRPASPGWRASRSDSSSASVPPFPATVFSPPVYCLRIVGTLTSIAMNAFLRHTNLPLAMPTPLVSYLPSISTLPRRLSFRRLRDHHLFFADFAVDDAE